VRSPVGRNDVNPSPAHPQDGREAILWTTHSEQRGANRPQDVVGLGIGDADALRLEPGMTRGQIDLLVFRLK
jgi:hypothetical protein